MKYLPSIALVILAGFAALIGAGKQEYTYQGVNPASLQPYSANLASWSAIAPSAKQDASANLTNWSALTATKQSLGIRAQIGVTSADGSNTNTWETPFSSAPAVFVQTFNQFDVLTNTVTVNSATTNVVNLGKAGVTYYLLGVVRDTP